VDADLRQRDGKGLVVTVHRTSRIAAFAGMHSV
jgi:hypothetical protein